MHAPSHPQKETCRSTDCNIPCSGFGYDEIHASDWLRRKPQDWRKAKHVWWASTAASRPTKSGWQCIQVWSPVRLTACRQLEASREDFNEVDLGFLGMQYVIGDWSESLIPRNIDLETGRPISISSSLGKSWLNELCDISQVGSHPEAYIIWLLCTHDAVWLATGDWLQFTRG